MNQVKVDLPSGNTITVDYGTRVSELLEEKEFSGLREKTVAAKINNELVSLSFKIEINSNFKTITLEDPQGSKIYQASLCFVLAKAAHKIFPKKTIKISHSIGDGYLYLFHNGSEINKKDLEALKSRMELIIQRDEKITRVVYSYQEAIDFFKKMNQFDTVNLLSFKNHSKIPLYQCGGFLDLAYVPLAPSTGWLKNFKLELYNGGLVLRSPSNLITGEFRRFQPSSTIYSIYKEYKDWGKILKVSTVGDLNKVAATKQIRDFITVAEALHENKISNIAHEIKNQRDSIKAVLIAGPSSSGKTTFTKKLAIYLQVHGFNPVILNLDNYFVPREQTPRDENGDYDFEALEAIDIKTLNKDLLDLFDGKEIDMPVFDFKKGLPVRPGVPLKIPERGILVMEGIHGLNDKLTPDIPRKIRFKIYVSALTQLNLDDHNRISTTDNRLIRRMVRDNQFRGHSADNTLKMWPSVRRGENKNIFPFQDSADMVFNSALDYELGVLRTFAEPLLKTVKPSNENYDEALRLLAFIENFVPIPSHFIPGQSIIREFIGNSSFKY